MNRIPIDIELSPESLARALAGLDSIRQARFFHEFAQELLRECRNPSRVADQVWHIHRDMPEQSKKLLGWGAADD